MHYFFKNEFSPFSTQIIRCNGAENIENFKRSIAGWCEESRAVGFIRRICRHARTLTPTDDSSFLSIMDNPFVSSQFFSIFACSGAITDCGSLRMTRGHGGYAVQVMKRPPAALTVVIVMVLVWLFEFYAVEWPLLAVGRRCVLISCFLRVRNPLPQTLK